MTIPKYDELFIGVLYFLKDRSERKPRELELPLADLHNLSEEDVSKLYESGNGPIFFDRISWSLSYLRMAGLVEKPKRGIYKISEEGIKLLLTPENIKSHVKKKLNKRDEKKKKEKSESPDNNGHSDLTPQEKLYESYESIRQSAYEDILDTIISKSPKEFEHLVVKQRANLTPISVQL